MIREDFRVARLISRYLSGDITSEEKDCLDDWRQKDRDHESLFQKICNEGYYARHESRKKEYDLQAGWEGIEKRIKRMNSGKKYLKLMRYAAIIAIPLLLLIPALRTPQELPGMDGQRLSDARRILPGGAKAVLTLDNGEVVHLEGDFKRQQMQLAGERIQVDSTTLNYSSAQERSAQLVPRYNKVETPQGGEYLLVLNDGTKVHLNSMSSLRFPVTFGSGKREVELTGEAYFEVNGTGQPFIVHTQGMQIEVLGTAFNISAYPGEEYQTTLVSGSVKVDAGEGRSLILKPSQQASLTPGKGDMQVRTVDVAFYTSWVNGKINFRDRRLEDIMKILSRWYNIEVDYADERLKNKRFGCYVNRYEEIAPFLDLLEATENIYVRINGNTITLYN